MEKKADGAMLIRASAKGGVSPDRPSVRPSVRLAAPRPAAAGALTDPAN